MDCTEYLPFSKDDILLDLQLDSKEAVIRRLAASVCEHIGIEQLDKVCAAVLNREKSHPTGLAHGIACPHGFIKGLPGLCVAIARLTKAVDFGARDGIPARHVFLILSPENQDGSPYIKALSSITKYYSNPALLDQLAAASTKEEYWELLQGCHDA